MDNEFVCPECTQEYSHQNLPRLLTMCGHTYCEKCVEALKMPSEQQGRCVVTCPEDKESIQVDLKGFSIFPKNMALIKLMDGQKNNTLSFKDDLGDVSKITKSQELQEDEEAKELITAINNANESSNSSKTLEDLTKALHPNTSLSSSSRNETISEQMQIDEDKTAEICLLHNKPLEVVCTIDMMRICSKCAIFGEHKGHEFKSIEEIDNTNKENQQELVLMFDKKNSVTERVSNQNVEKQVVGILKAKIATVKKQVSEKYKSLQEQIVKAELQTKTKIDQMEERLCGQIRDTLKIDEKVLSAYQEWENNTFCKIQQSENNGFQGKMTLFLKGEDLIHQGQEVISKIKNCEELMFNKVDTIISEIGFKSNDAIVQSIHNYIIIQQNTQKQDIHLKNYGKQNSSNHINQTLHLQSAKKKIQLNEPISENDLSLLDQIETDIISERSFILQEPIKKMKVAQKTQRISIGSKIKQPLYLRSNKKKVMPKQKEEMSMISTSFMIEKKQPTAISKKKLKSLKVPQKYEKVLEGISNDSLQIIDFTNAELGDTMIAQICEYIKNCSKVKTLKLIRNKLTDEGLMKILHCLGGIITLNLSQNGLTQHTLQILGDHRSNLQNLKTVVLSQNKIVQRKHKVPLQKLRKTDLTVSV